MSANCCIIGADPARYQIEDAYLTGAPISRYSRAQVERHMSHIADPAALRQITDLATASGLAARLHQLELTATAIMDKALREEDGKLALAALREARSTLGEMAKLTEALSSTSGKAEENVALDDLLWSALGGQAPQHDQGGTGGGEYTGPRELEPGDRG